MLLPGRPQPVNGYVADMNNQRVTCTGTVIDYFQNCSCYSLGQQKVSCEVYILREYATAFGICSICWCIAIISYDSAVRTKITRLLRIQHCYSCNMQNLLKQLTNPQFINLTSVSLTDFLCRVFSLLSVMGRNYPKFLIIFDPLDPLKQKYAKSYLQRGRLTRHLFT